MGERKRWWERVVEWLASVDENHEAPPRRYIYTGDGWETDDPEIAQKMLDLWQTKVEIVEHFSARREARAEADPPYRERQPAPTPPEGEDWEQWERELKDPPK